MEKMMKKARGIRKGILELLSKNIDQVADNIVYGELEYSQVVNFFITRRPKDQRVAKGAMFVEKHARGLQVTQLFLDDAGIAMCDSAGKPYGRRILVSSLDKELEAIAGSGQMAIFE